jgi:hypothetical protein
MAVDSNVTLIKNDGSETFNLPATSVQFSGERSVAAKAGKGAVKKIAGGVPEVDLFVFEVSGRIQNISGSDYPNNGDYTDDNAGFETELRRTLKDWNPEPPGKFDTLKWDAGVYTGGGANRREVPGTVTSVQTSQDTTQDGPRQYTFTIEFSQFDAYVDKS